MASDRAERLAEIEERWNAVKPTEREAFLLYGTKAAPGESPSDYAERILKADLKISLEGARVVSRIFRAAYNELVTP